MEVKRSRGAVIALAETAIETLNRGHGLLGRMAEMAHLRRELIPLKGKSDRAPGGRRLLLRRHRARWPGAGWSQRRGQAQGESSQAQDESSSTR